MKLKVQRETSEEVTIDVRKDGDDVAITANGVAVAYILADGTLRPAYHSEGDRARLQFMGIQLDNIGSGYSLPWVTRVSRGHKP